MAASFPRRDELITLAQLQDLIKQVESTRELNEYERQEAETRLKLFDILPNSFLVYPESIRFTNPFDEEHRFALYDCFFNSGGTEVFLELKTRTCDSTQYRDWQIEESKAAELEQASRKWKIPVLFASLGSDGVLLLWDISQEHRSESKKCPKSTYDESQGKIVKLNRYYPTKTAMRIQ